MKTNSAPTTPIIPNRSRGPRRKWRLCAGIALMALPAWGGLDLRSTLLPGDVNIRLLNIARNGSDIAVTFDATQGATYRLERKVSLIGAAWQSIPGVNDLTATSNGPALIIDPGAVSLGKAFYRVQDTVCDSGLPSNSSDGLQYAAAMELCQTTTESGPDYGVISATFTLPSGTGVPDARSRAIRPAFGTNNIPRAGNAMVVFSTGAAAATGQTNPSFFAFQPGLNTGTSSAAPADWLAANGGTFPTTPGCPAAGSTTANNPVMLKLRIRVPGGAHSFKVSAKFFSAEYAEYVCSPFNDVFVVLLDSAYTGTPANPADKNLATYTAPSGARYPLGVNLARDNTGLFTQCINGATGCAGGNPGTTNSCVSTGGLTGTGMDTADPGNCNSSSRIGGGTDWLAIRGNVIPGEIIELRFALWDTSDGLYDSVVLLDNFAWSPNTVTPGTSLE